MITGLELAFAIVPLVVSATEHHQKAYRKYKTFTAPDEKLEDFLSDLHDEISLLGLTLRNLVSDLPTLTDKQKDAILNLDRGIWGQEDVTNAIQARLGGNADQAFSDILTRLLKCLDEVVSEKAFIFVSSGDMRSPGIFKKLEGFREKMKNGSTVHDLRSRFQFTTKEDRRNKNIRKISKYNKKLERFVHGNNIANNTVEVIKNSRRKAVRTPTNRSRRLSTDAHIRISQNWVDCPCPAPHEARLGLLKCLMDPELAESQMNLDLLVSMTSPDDQTKEIWLESKIRILLEEEEGESESFAREESNPRAGVRFALPIEEQTPPPSPIELQQMNPQGSRHYIEKESVCMLIKEAHKNKSNLELVFDGKKLWRSRASRSRVILRPEIGIPLKELLGETSARLTLKQRRALAVVLSHAILHYCESPWVSDNWNKEHVNFFSTETKGPDLMRPYLATQFDPMPKTSDGLPENMYSHPNPALLSLGILLLELYISKPIESMWADEDTDEGIAGINTNWFTAEKLLESMGDDVYEGYRRAVQACLNVDYSGHGASLSLDDEEFRRMVFDRVVAPLEEELYNGFHITPEELGVLEAW